jgi:hypothetical protein
MSLYGSSEGGHGSSRHGITTAADYIEVADEEDRAWMTAFGVDPGPSSLQQPWLTSAFDMMGTYVRDSNQSHMSGTVVPTAVDWMYSDCAYSVESCTELLDALESQLGHTEVGGLWGPAILTGSRKAPETLHTRCSSSKLQSRACKVLPVLSVSCCVVAQ